MKTLQHLSIFFYRLSNNWAALISLLVFIAFMILILPVQADLAQRNSNGAASPDSSFFYSADDLYAIAEAYGETGRAAYVRARWTFDVIWPLVYTAFLTTGISWFFVRGIAPGSPWRLLNLFPAIGMLFDLLENTAATLVMVSFPASVPFAAMLAPVFTLIKWFFVIASFIVLLAGAAAALIKTRKKKQKV